MSEGNIAPIPGSPYASDKVRGKHSGVKKSKNKEAKKATPDDKVELQPKQKEGTPLVSEDDMSRYLKIVKEEPDIHPEKVEEAKDNLHRGIHGQKALDAIVQGVGETLGVLPPKEN